MRDSLTRALELLAAGAWQEAHEIVQERTSARAAWLHGIVHLLEGDLDNARYWYEKAGRAFPGRRAVRQEIAAATRGARGAAVSGDRRRAGRARPARRRRS